MEIRRRKLTELVDERLKTFRRSDWELLSDAESESAQAGRPWAPAFQRWRAARKAWMEAHPDSGALGSALEQIRAEVQGQMQAAQREHPRPPAWLTEQ